LCGSGGGDIGSQRDDEDCDSRKEDRSVNWHRTLPSARMARKVATSARTGRHREIASRDDEREAPNGW
jgi:hypothetical protein